MVDKIPCEEGGSLILPNTRNRTNGKCMPCFKKENPFWPLDLGENNSTLALAEEETKHEQKKHLSELNIDLYKILEGEIEAGNRVVETSAGWPEPDSIFVRLEKPFQTKIHNLPEHILFREINDPHYWKSEFMSKLNHHVLACRF